MKKTILCIISLFLTYPLFAEYVITGGNGTPYLVEERGNIQVYLLNGLSGAQISFNSTNPQNVRWFKYNTSASQSIPVPSFSNGSASYIADVQDGWGYYVQMETLSYVWIIDYSKYVPYIGQMTIDEGNAPCERIRINPDVEAAELSYFSSLGEERIIPNQFYLIYDKLVWNAEMKSFIEEKAKDIVKTPISFISVDAPLMNTSFTLRDAFSELLGMKPNESQIPEYTAKALKVYSYAYLPNDEGIDEEYSSGEEISSLKAPFNVRLEAYANDIPQLLYIWKLEKLNYDSQTWETIGRYDSNKAEASITQSGQYRVMLEVSSRLSECKYENPEDPEFTFFVEDSKLVLPNFFSPGSSFGSNDVYKVSHKSLLSFKAFIFNRWGNQLYSWDDPDQGWDGRVNGKYVPTGVYFIIVEAQGADGKKYKLSKDINVLRARN